MLSPWEFNSKDRFTRSFAALYDRILDSFRARVDVRRELEDEFESAYHKGIIDLTVDGESIERCLLVEDGPFTEARMGGITNPIAETMDLDNSGRISHRSIGQFNPEDWLREGDGFLASSRKTREIWAGRRQTFSQTVEERKSGSPDHASDWNLLDGLVRASMLLLGYSVEMYLKAGLAKAYYGCCEEMFDRDVKRRFGHKLVCLAKEIAFPLGEKDVKDLKLLQRMILVDARYPIRVRGGASYADAVNKRTGTIWSPDVFEACTELASRIKRHSRAIDADRNNPALLHIQVNIDEDGYLAFRVGGNLPPRITYRFSSVQRREGAIFPADIKALFTSSRFRPLMDCWECAWIYEDGQEENGQKKTFLRAHP